MAPESDNSLVLRSSYSNDPEFAPLLELFIDELPQRVETILSASRAAEWETLRRVAHQLRGSSAGYGFPMVGQTAGRIDDALRKSLPTDEVQLMRLRGEVDELVNLCKRVIAGRAAA